MRKEKSKLASPSMIGGSLAALGVVYGDIGTSPLYALKACFGIDSGIAPSFDNIVGILSLIFWAITWVVVFKYLTILMRADNNGEGGIMALIALLIPRRGSTERRTSYQSRIIFFGLFGAALLYGDGMITPAVSVLSAVEGLGVATPFFKPFIVPITVVILIGLFAVQKFGTEKVGKIFGPAMLVWFATLAFGACPWLIKHPEIFKSLNPFYGINFLLNHGTAGALVLTGVVLCITGAEALYADMGHFGPVPIRRAWYAVVYPALILNYFGQGALLIENPHALETNPFFAMYSVSLLYPVVIIATLATVIASQALISGSFSMTQQAISLGYLPRFRIFHTSDTAEGQIYIPKINSFLLISCVALVIAFQSSDALTGAYGIAVTGTMLITSLLFYQVSRQCWKWSIVKASTLTGLFILVDVILLVPNLTKIIHGGWVPVVAAIVIYTLMTTWSRGHDYIVTKNFERSMDIGDFLKRLAVEKPTRVKGTSLFVTRDENRVPGDLLHNYKHNKVIHESVILLVFSIDHIPETPIEQHARVRPLGSGIFEVRANFGFMEKPNLEEILISCEINGARVNPADISYYLSRDILRTHGDSQMANWRKRFYAFTSTNAQPVMEFLGINPEWVIETGAVVNM